MTDAFERIWKKNFVEDDNSLVDGIRNLATTYFDTTSEFNKTHAHKVSHPSFQTVKGKSWQESVKQLMGSEKFEKMAGQESLLRQFIKTSVGAGVQGEISVATTVAGALTDFVLDTALDHFKTQPVEEIYERGAWVIVFRGHNHDKTKRLNELRAETAMFGDYDDVMQKDEETKMYSPGFYVNKVGAQHQHIVYVFDTNEPMTMDYREIRLVTDPATKMKYDMDSGMTEIRELFFLRAEKDNIKYAKAQVGDEVIFRNKKYVVTQGSPDTLWLKSPDTNDMIQVDPQQVEIGPREHWSAQTPSQFRTVAFTFSLGDYAYRPITVSDHTPTRRARAVLCCIRYCEGDNAEVVDAWDGHQSEVEANALVKPPFVVRRLLDNSHFAQFKKAVLSGQDGMYTQLSNHSEFEDVCYGYDTQFKFTSAHVLGSAQQATQAKRRDFRQIAGPNDIYAEIEEERLPQQQPHRDLRPDYYQPQPDRVYQEVNESNPLTPPAAERGYVPTEFFTVVGAFLTLLLIL